MIVMLLKFVKKIQTHLSVSKLFIKKISTLNLRTLNSRQSTLNLGILNKNFVY